MERKTVCLELEADGKRGGGTRDVQGDIAKAAVALVVVGVVECTGDDDEAQEEEPGEEFGKARINSEALVVLRLPPRVNRCTFRRRELWLRACLNLGVCLWTRSRISIEGRLDVRGGSNCAVLSLLG